ncbi:diguanylate cyclase (GGDEF)-like protein [Crenobacter luteus]|uniref:diguanylate cyclase n=1 Tax=Crenobacter luteus TaxID=1452487 RepID=UPI001053417D|nr:diguanylate cyclase [Crenobacter luteus]TCP15094.1 diguanylate cyclase (GGDEF)-like protein [Crenobacter luteus]
MNGDDGLETRVEALLAAPAHDAAALHVALAALYARYRDLAAQIERVTRIADRYQGAERERGRSYAVRYEKQLRQIEKIMRISDRYQSMLRDLNDRLHWLSLRDVVTGLPNRRHMLGRLDDAVADAKEGGAPLALAIADVDHFKRINDGFGHDTGDKALAALGHALCGLLPDGDAARWGGEEFLLLFPAHDLAAARRRLDALRAALPGAMAPLWPDGVPTLTLSCGLTAWRGDDDALSALLSRADEALYVAKRGGRDRLVVAD